MGISVAGISGFGFAGNVGNGDNTAFKQDDVDNVEVRRLKVAKPLYCPYYSLTPPTQQRGDGDHYWKSDAFADNPFTIEAPPPCFCSLQLS